MLFDPRWQNTRKHSLSDFVAWLELQPADGTYIWDDSDVCLCAQYYGKRYWYEADDATRRTDGVRLDDIAKKWPRTYGGALERARRFAGAS
jgi:hypothetical protein